MRFTDNSRHVTEPDKLATLKAYRRAKGLCFTCGERWGKDHKCSATVYLHVVQEMLSFCSSESVESKDSEDDLMVLCAETQSTNANTSAIKLPCRIAGHDVLFLLDSGSSHSFLSAMLAQHFSDAVPLPTQRVRIAGGGHLLCTHMISQCKWTAAGHEFHTDFKVLPLQHYDGIIGMDWLSAGGTMNVNWDQNWLSFDHHGASVFLQGALLEQFMSTVVELQLIQEQQQTAEPLPPELQRLLDSYPEVFSLPPALPPRRSCDHTIPLIEGARPVRIRPYCYSPELKTEIEKQIQAMLDSGEISVSTSEFASPIIMVRKKDFTWRLCVDYHNLNLLTLKSKYPLPVIDELLDELTGASWFSKLDLRAGYHQIRLAPGEEYKTAFHTHNDHYQFNVMAFGLTGAPATF